MKLALGSAQFGLNYGITNQAGQVAPALVSLILQEAHKAGIDTIDSALAYGNSQAVLASTQLLSNFSLVSKIQLKHHLSIEEQLMAIMQQSQLTRFAGILFHDADEHDAKTVIAALEELASLQSQFGITKIGISTYEPATLMQILPYAPCQLVQFPLNLFDQRFLAPEVQQLCQQMQIECHARSLFLQGLLLTETANIPAQFAPFRQHFQQRDLLAAKDQLSLMQLAMSMINFAPHIRRWVLGVCEPKQLQQLLDCYATLPAIDGLSQLQSNEFKLIRPDYW